MNTEESTNMEDDALGEALQRATSEPAHRPAFYHLLMESTVLVIGSAEGATEGRAELQAGSKITLQNWEKPDGSLIVPFFSSVGALQRAIEAQRSYIALPVRSLFEITRGATLVLNPNSTCWKEFLPAEIESLLSEGAAMVPTQTVLDQPTQVLLGQPENYPTAMADSLRILFAKHPNVEAAYLALMHAPSLHAEPHLVVGIQADGDIESVMREAGAVAADRSPDGRPVDLVAVTPGEEGFAEYFIEQTTPFYKR